MNPTNSNAPVAPERIMQMAWGYAPPLAIEAGIRLKMFDTIAAGKKTLDEIVVATGCSPRGTAILLNMLTGLGFLEKSPDKYDLTPESEAFLVSSSPKFQGGMFKHMSRQLIPNWLNLAEIVRTGKPAEAVNSHKDGAAFFEQFVEDIFPMSYASAKTLTEHLQVAKSTRAISVLDLATGSGVWGIALAQASKNVKVRAVDWPTVLRVTERVAKKFGVADRFTFAPGDLLEADFGSGHQIATLGHILHSEGEKRSQELLNKTFRTLVPGGTIAIAEFLVNADRTGPLSGLIFATNMLVQTSVGNTYSFEEIERWLQQVGFRNVRKLEAPGPSPLILADRPA